MLTSALLVFGFLGFVSCQAGRQLNSACETHHDCNDPHLPGTLPYTYCSKVRPNDQFGKCICHPYFSALTGGGGSCRRAFVGAQCTVYGTERDQYCQKGVGPGVFCDPQDGRCRCDNDHEAKTNKCGQKYCSPIGAGSSCEPGNAGNALCRRVLKDATASCHATTKVCVCGIGNIYSKQDRQCVVIPTAPLRETVCKACIETGGVCYSSVGEGFPDTCECPACKATSPNKDWKEVGCDLLYADVGDICSVTRDIRCRDPHALCLHANILEDVSYCQCAPGYVQICDFNGGKKCAKEISRLDDKNCEKCWARGGRCYQDSPSDFLPVAIGCVCPSHLSTSDLNNPATFCDTEHVNVTCTSQSMKVCYDPEKHTRYPDVTKELMDLKARLFIENHEDDRRCQFELDTESQRWCITLDLHNKLQRCGITVTHPSRSTISYTAIVVLQRHRYKITASDFCLCAYCVYDTLVDIYTGLIVSKKVRFSSGVEISPDVDMVIQSEHSKLSYYDTVTIGENIRLCIRITDDKNVYEALKAQICIVSNSHVLFNKRDTMSCLIINNGCVVGNNYLSVLDNFRPLPTDPKHICTGYFPAFQFTEFEKLYFHCAVKTCRAASDCTPSNCTCLTNGKKKKRSTDVAALQTSMLTTVHTLESDHYVMRWKRAVEADEKEKALAAFNDPNYSHQMVGITVQPAPVDKKGRKLETDILIDDVEDEEDAEIERLQLMKSDMEVEEEEVESSTMSETVVVVLIVVLTAVATFILSAFIYFKACV